MTQENDYQKDSTPYEIKFQGLIRLCDKAIESGVKVLVIAQPEVLGDNYDEIIESLNRISQAGLQLLIAPPEESKT